MVAPGGGAVSYERDTPVTGVPAWFQEELPNGIGLADDCVSSFSWLQVLRDDEQLVVCVLGAAHRMISWSLSAHHIIAVSRSWV